MKSLNIQLDQDNQNGMAVGRVVFRTLPFTPIRQVNPLRQAEQELLKQIYGDEAESIKQLLNLVTTLAPNDRVLAEVDKIHKKHEEILSCL